MHGRANTTFFIGLNHPLLPLWTMFNRNMIVSGDQADIKKLASGRSFDANFNLGLTKFTLWPRKVEKHPVLLEPFLNLGLT